MPIKRRRVNLVAATVLLITTIAGCGGNSLKSAKFSTDDYDSIFEKLREIGNKHNTMLYTIDKEVNPSNEISGFEIVRSGDQFEAVARMPQAYQKLDVETLAGKDTAVWIDGYSLEIYLRPRTELIAAHDALVMRSEQIGDFKERRAKESLAVDIFNAKRFSAHADLLSGLLQASKHPMTKNALEPKCDTLIDIHCVDVGQKAKALEEEAQKGRVDAPGVIGVIVVRVIDIPKQQVVVRKYFSPKVGLLGPLPSFSVWEETRKFITSLVDGN